MKNIFKFFAIIYFVLFNNLSYSQVINEILIEGNERVSDETIIMFSNLSKEKSIDENDINEILNNLYDTNFFENISVKFQNNTLKIVVSELPLIQEVKLTGVKAKKYKDQIQNILKLKSRSSYNSNLLLEDKNQIQSKLRELGFYFAKVDTFVETLEDNKVNVEYKIDIGNKAKIKKITFLGDKIYKDSKLRSIIISEEYKFWKFISGKKFLREDLISIDKNLLKNFYLNKGYYNVIINSSFAKIINEEEFELIYNINPNDKIFFNELELLIPEDFERENFKKLDTVLKDLKGKPYSINSVNKILKEIDLVTITDEYKSIKANVEENLISNLLNIKFKIIETEKFFVERINIFGNNVTRENVIRNQLEIDEGDPFNDILNNKSLNNLKSLDFFKNVKSDVIDGSDKNSKIINITVQEKPTGEIAAGAGAGTNGGTIGFSVKENNYLGKGLGVEATATITEETFKGVFSVNNPNYNNSDKSLFANFQAIEIDKLSNFGYKTNKTGVEVGTKFEYLNDLKLGLSTSSFYEKIETDATASARQKKQTGDYFDTFIKFNFDYDKRNQKFKTSDGFRSFYSLDVPLISDNNTLKNTYSYKYFTELYENNISTMSLFLQSANSLTGDDIKLTERLNIPSRRLRGFESGKVGPKDGNDYIGGNYVSTINLSTTIPKLFENFQNVDASLFLDAANIWGVDYDSSLSDSSGIRSSIGIGIDYFTVIGPINFSITEALTKESTDITETIRFNIGTTF
tara:strand:+ start:2641 stop:4881 length:2241 start_codon:yes stop_codon:yes gene_type:complete